MENLRSLEIFLAVAEALSFAEAARRLGLSSSATGKAIGGLEARLGVRLFNRTTRRVSLTPEGQVLLGRGRRLRDEWRETEALLSASGAEPQGLFRLSLPAVGYRFLAPHLAAFMRAYPKVRLDLDFDDRIKDVVAEGFDLAIRSGVLPDSALMSRKLGVFQYFLCAAPSYLAEHGEPATIAALSGHRLICFRHPGTDVLQDWRLANGSMVELDRAMQAVICTNMEAVRVAAIAGLGVAWAPDFLVDDALKSGQLIVVLRSEATEGRSGCSGLQAGALRRVCAPFWTLPRSDCYQIGLREHETQKRVASLSDQAPFRESFNRPYSRWSCQMPLMQRYSRA